MGDAKAFLQQVKLYDTNIDSKLEEVARLKDLMLKITTTLKGDPVSGTRTVDKMGDAVSKIVDLEREINEDIDAYVLLKRQVRDVVEKVKDPDQAAVLYKRYFHYEHWEQIAYEMGYTYRHITRLHGEALQAVRKILNEKDVLKCP